MIRIDVNFIKEDWGLFFEFSMATVQMDPNNKKIRILAMEVEPVTVTDPKFGNGQTIYWMLHWEQDLKYQ